MLLLRSFFSLGLISLVILPVTSDWSQPSALPTTVALVQHPIPEISSCIAPPNEVATFAPTPGTPFTAVPSANGCWVFAGLTSTSQIAIFRRDRGVLKLQDTVPLQEPPTDLVLTHDGQLLLAATGNSVTAIDVSTLTQAKSALSIHTIRGTELSGTIHVNVTHDDTYLFVANERGGTITVINLKQARASGFRSSGIVGNIPAAEAPIAVTLSPDNKLLYSTSEFASGPVAKGWDCGLCRQGLLGTSDVASGILAKGGAGCETEGPGGVEVIDVARAETDPAHSVLSFVPAGCEPVRLVLSDDGATAYITARGEDAVLAFDTARLRSDPAHALLGQAPAGTAPVGLAIAAGRLIIASSNRFQEKAQPQHLTILDADHHNWKIGSTLKAELPAGSFPREERLSPDGKTLYVTNFTSNQLEMVDLTRLPVLASPKPAQTP